MPGLNGLLTSKRIRNYENNKKLNMVKIMLLTGEVDEKLSLNKDIDKYLLKPFKKNNLYKEIYDLLNK